MPMSIMGFLVPISTAPAARPDPALDPAAWPGRSWELRGRIGGPSVGLTDGGQVLGDALLSLSPGFVMLRGSSHDLEPSFPSTAFHFLLAYSPLDTGGSQDCHCPPTQEFNNIRGDSRGEDSSHGERQTDAVRTAAGSGLRIRLGGHPSHHCHCMGLVSTPLSLFSARHP